ncbi:MAG: cell division protein FtsQ/DivIB [Acidisphaera sp.]|nr:cell division protein FtsQ/DivIB [Acidisphaera sp.]MBV9812601.1 cell division protein FtsQ/DivIB [Acetobacteraceae bacterium]
MPDRPGRWRLLWKKRRRLFRMPVLLGVVLVGGVVVLAAAGFAHRGPPLRERLGNATASLGMRIRAVEIEGRQKTPEPLLRAAIGAGVGQSILSYSLADARARIETLTWVQSATVERRLPSTLVVQLVERRPFAVWQMDGKFKLIDRNGEIVTDSDVAQLADKLPLVVGGGAPPAAAALLDALAAQPAVQSHVTAAVRIGERRWNLRLNNGADVLLPEGAEPQAIARLAQLQSEHALLDRPLAVIDMRLPDRLVVRPRPDSVSQDKPATAPAAPVRKPT